MRVLVVDDDAAILEALKLSLTFRWPDCEVLCASSGEEGLGLFREQRPDVLVLDIGLPGLSGIDLLRRLREESSVPVLMLTARNQEADIVRALEIGADDYVTKPAGYLELTARIQSLMRRAQIPVAPVPALQTYSQGGLTIHFPSRDVEVSGRSIPLTNTEYRLLYHLVRNAGRVVSHHDLLQTAWGSDSYGEDVVRVYVSRLRAKIEPDPGRPRYIVTKSGLGYLFVGEPGTPADDHDVAAGEVGGASGTPGDGPASTSPGGRGEAANERRPDSEADAPRRLTESSPSSSRLAAHAS